MVWPQRGPGGFTNCGRSRVRGVVGRHDMSSCTENSWRLRGGAALVLAFLVVTVFGRPASAETLEEALADAYLINPVLNAERARLRAVDEQVALAKSGLRPLIFGTADTAFLNTITAVGRTLNYSTIESGLFTGTTNQTFPTFFPLTTGALPLNEAFGQGESGEDGGVTNPRGYAINLSQPIF